MNHSLLRNWLAAPEGRLTWIDFDDYARRVFAGDPKDWFSDANRYAAALVQAQSLLPTKCLGVDLTAPCVSAGLETGADAVCEALTAADTRQFIDDVFAALGHRFQGEIDLIATISAPRDLLGGVQDDFDVLDDVATALGQRLRELGAASVAGVVIRFSSGEALSADEGDACEPLISIARHYDWCVGLEFGGDASAPESAADLEHDFLLLPDREFADLTVLSHSTPIGGGLTQGFWCGHRDQLPEESIAYGRIGTDATPEQVLEAVESLG